MNWHEQVLPVPLPGAPDHFGLLCAPTPCRVRLGVLIVVGGPQYRIGAHRHFVTLARQLAAAGIPSLRFDHRGLGDTGLPLQPFEDLDDDIAAGIQALLAAQAGLEGVVLWGLCDAASASLLYVARRTDARVRALALLNPWVRSPAGEARARIQHYYWERLRSADFWRKLLQGGVRWGAARDWWRLRRQARSGPTDPANPASPTAPFQTLMARGWHRFNGPILLQLSGRDQTAREFEGVADVFPVWAGWPQHPGLTRQDHPEADHTFSQRDLQDASSQALIAWLKGLR